MQHSLLPAAGMPAPEPLPQITAPPLPRCAWCAQPGAMFAEEASHRSCAHCHLACHLERARIDEEATLVWLPEIEQRSLNVLCRELYQRMHLLGVGLGEDAPVGPDPEAAALRAARAALLQRSDTVASRLGTSRPSDLADALRFLPPALHDRRGELLGGLRVLPLGRFFAGHRDVYPEILEAWRRPAADQR